MRRVVGIDASLTGFAVGVGTLDEVTSAVGVELFTLPPLEVPRTLAQRIRRYQRMADQAAGRVREAEPELVLLEGYAMHARGTGVSKLYELGAVLRERLLQDAAAVVEVPPSTAKRFATGKGNANKTAVASALASRYLRTFDSDDEADAYGLVRLGLVAVEAVGGETVFQREAADEVRRLWAIERGEMPPPPRKKSRRRRSAEATA